MEIFSLRMVSLSCFTLAVCSFTWAFRSRSMVSSSLAEAAASFCFLCISHNFRERTVTPAAISPKTLAFIVAFMAVQAFLASVTLPVSR